MLYKQQLRCSICMLALFKQFSIQGRRSFTVSGWMSRDITWRYCKVLALRLLHQSYYIFSHKRIQHYKMIAIRRTSGDMEYCRLRCDMVENLNRCWPSRNHIQGCKHRFVQGSAMLWLFKVFHDFFNFFSWNGWHPNYKPQISRSFCVISRSI